MSTIARRKLLLACAVIGVPLTALAMWFFRHDVTGFVRGEARYRGRYTNEWKAEVERRITRRRHPERNAWEQVVFSLFALQPEPATMPGVLEPDADAVPVLCELLHDDDADVRRSAAMALSRIQPKADAIRALCAVVDEDADPEVKNAARHTLVYIFSRYFGLAYEAGGQLALAGPKTPDRKPAAAATDPMG